MNISHKLELTYIPSSYWNEPLSGFKLLSNGKKLSRNSEFFIAWNPTIRTEEDLNQTITSVFPNIPVDKLLVCTINLAKPTQNSKKATQGKATSKFFDIVPFLGKILPIAPTIKLLYQQSISESNEESKHQFSNSVKTWAYLTKLLFELLNRGQFIPTLEGKTQDTLLGKWKILITTQDDRERYKIILDKAKWPAFSLPVNFIKNNGEMKSSGLWHPSFLFSKFLNEISDVFIRSILNKNDFTTFNDFYSKEIKKETDIYFKSSWDYRFLKALINSDQIFKIDGFHETILPSLIDNWTQSTQGVLLEHNYTFNIEIKYPKEVDDQWILSFYISSPEFDDFISLSDIWEGKFLLKREKAKNGQTQSRFLESILKALGIAIKAFPPIKRGLVESIQNEVSLSSKEIIDFLRYPKDLLIQSGFNVILPEVFRKGGKHRLSPKLIIRLKNAKKEESSGYSILPSIFDVNSMLDSKWEITLGTNLLSDGEVQNIISSNEPLVNINGNWVLIEQQDIEELKQIQKPEIHSYMEALKLGLTGKVHLEENNAEYDLVVEGDLHDIIQNLKNLEQIEEIPSPSNFKGKLRSYQQEGLAWMGNLAKYNFGLCLADDMGLGKTIQIIAFLAYLKKNFPNNKGSYLIICPTSILFNWEREIKKFAPDSEIYFHHGPNRVKDPKYVNELIEPHRIILTSYGTIRNDIDLLQTVEFSGVIIDESQNMKNFASQQTQAIYKLKSQFRICLSGTPIENRLLELWSLFNFLNPGLLGPRGQFQREFILPIERFQEQTKIDNLKKIISPFILRRVKSDKSIIKDLPEKNEMKVLIDLSERQVELYKELVNKELKELQTSKKENKNALILSLLLKLKQICNHPYQYLKTDIDSVNLKEKFKEIVSESKKLKRLLQMTEEVINNRGKILIFTQFTQMGKILERILEMKFNSKILYFHGAVQEKKRKEIVDEFQSTREGSPQILIVSLKAGGTGLNLTQGTTVIHFDRWWNPAVENQATDRAYRIGQKSVVNVYKFISKGTVEEKIDVLLEEKKDLADKIITSTGESWIYEFDGEKLKEILLLSE